MRLPHPVYSQADQPEDRPLPRAAKVAILAVAVPMILIFLAFALATATGTIPPAGRGSDALTDRPISVGELVPDQGVLTPTH